MSGRRGKFAAECAPEDERDSLYETHLFAEALYAEKDLSGPAAKTAAEMAVWRALAQRLKQETPPAQQP